MEIYIRDRQVEIYIARPVDRDRWIRESGSWQGTPCVTDRKEMRKVKVRLIIAQSIAQNDPQGEKHQDSKELTLSSRQCQGLKGF